MNPTSEATKLEGATRFHEYTGVGKLRNKKVLITGGEHAHHLLELHFLDPIKTALSTSLKAPLGRIHPCHYTLLLPLLS